MSIGTNYIDTLHSIDTAAVTLGLGYQLERPENGRGPRKKAPLQQEYTTEQEITVFLGGTIVNSFNSELSAARGVEYRRGLSRHVDVTVGWINEGDAELIRRNGITTQLWLTRGFFDNNLTLGVGGGLYSAVDAYRDPLPGEGSGKTLAGIVTTTASIRFTDHWLTRFSWNRMVTDYNRDTDVIVLGFGYRL